MYLTRWFGFVLEIKFGNYDENKEFDTVCPFHDAGKSPYQQCTNGFDSSFYSCITKDTVSSFDENYDKKYPSTKPPILRLLNISDWHWHSGNFFHRKSTTGKQMRLLRRIMARIVFKSECEKFPLIAKFVTAFDQLKKGTTSSDKFCS